MRAKRPGVSSRRSATAVFDDASDDGGAQLERRRDLLVGKAGNEEVENRLPPYEAFRPALLRQRLRLVALKGGRGFVGHA